MVREAWSFLIPLGLCAAVCWALFGQLGAPAFGYAGGALVVLSGFVAFFFRDPERLIPVGDGIIVSAGDGRVVAVDPVEDDPWLGGRATQVSVFLSIFDVHVNRIPVSGEVERVVHSPGIFRLAFVPKASTENEQNLIHIRAQGYELAVKQIAGFVARRIICRLTEGEPVRIGQRFGLIKFGSRIDHILPPTAEIAVKVGDRVRAGETIIGVISK